MLRGLFNLLSDPALSAGGTLDELARTLRLRQWSGQDVIALRASGGQVTLHVRRGTTDHLVVWQCFKEHQFQIPSVRGVWPAQARAVANFYQQTLARNRIPLIFDCGANIGASTAWFMSHYPQAAITAIEPSPENFSVLRQNASGYPHVELVQAGVGPQDTMAYLHDAGGGAWGLQTLKENSGTPIQMVSVETLLKHRDSQTYQPFILKIDIEGAEQELFEGSWADIEKFPVVIIEPHDFCMPKRQTSFSFFRFHAAARREFLFGHENVFSLDMNALMPDSTAEAAQDAHPAMSP